jgi:transposase
MKHRRNRVVFKTYSPNQISLLPPSLDELIDINHPVRVVNAVIDKLALSQLEQSYKGGGTSSFHPRMLLKVLIYGYLSNIYSSRQLEASTKESIHMMWLAGMSRPDHNTINRFRGQRLKDQLKEIFRQVVLLLVESGHVSLKEIYTDGTKLESVANRYTFVWGRAIETNKKKMYSQLEELWNYTQKVASEELKSAELPAFEAIDSQKIAQTVNQIHQALKQSQVDESEKVEKKKVQAKASYAQRNWSSKWIEYGKSEDILGQRTSYSKTDTDATFMRLKDDHMQNGQLKPAYNWQVSTADQYVTHYSIHQTTTDTTLLKEHLAGFEAQYKQMPESITADAGYGSEENYAFLEEKNIEAFVKYNLFHHEQTDLFKAQINKVDNLYYNQEQNCFYCPMGQKMTQIGTFTKKTDNQYLQTITQYQAQNCHDCPLRGACHKQKGNRIIEVNLNLRLHKAKIREKLHSEEGIKHRKQRPQDVEATFGQIKSNHNFKRLRLKGLAKVEVEVGLACIAHNLRKKAYKDAKNIENEAKRSKNDNKNSNDTTIFKIKNIYPKIFQKVS